MASLYELTEIIRSKNAGPYELTFDVMFKNHNVYQAARNSAVITRELIASLYELEVEEVRVLVWFDQALALKITIPRRIPAGSPGERDLYGAQQHVLLESIEIPM